MELLENYIKSSLALSPSELETIKGYFKPVVLAKGDFLGKRGSFCDRLAFVNSGYLRVYVETPDREVTQWISSPGYFITDLSSFMYQVAGRWNIQALTECHAWEIRKKEYDELNNAMPRWKELDRMFIIKCFTLMEDRIFNHLYMSTDERFQMMMATQPELFNLVPLQYLASMLGMTPETLSRLRKKNMR